MVPQFYPYISGPKPNHDGHFRRWRLPETNLTIGKEVDSSKDSSEIEVERTPDSVVVVAPLSSEHIDYRQALINLQQYLSNLSNADCLMHQKISLKLNKFLLGQFDITQGIRNKFLDDEYPPAFLLLLEGLDQAIQALPTDANLQDATIRFTYIVHIANSDVPYYMKVVAAAAHKILRPVEVTQPITIPVKRERPAIEEDAFSVSEEETYPVIEKTNNIYDIEEFDVD